jgi:hypothetical protein
VRRQGGAINTRRDEEEPMATPSLGRGALGKRCVLAPLSVSLLCLSH